jgi:hypothetical protein
MKKMYAFCVFWGIAAALLPRVSFGETKSGDATIQSLTDSEGVVVKLGTDVSVSCRLRLMDLLGGKAISARANLQNTSKKQMYFSYNVAFFDGDHNLIGCASQPGIGSPMEPGDTLQLSSALVVVPLEEIKKIKSYQITWFESPDKAGL